MIALVESQNHSDGSPCTLFGKIHTLSLLYRDMDTVMGTIVDTEPPFNLQTWTNYPMTVVTSVTGYKIDYMQGPC